MALRVEDKVREVAAVGLALLLGSCAQPPAGDPAYDGLVAGAQDLARSTMQEALETARSRTSLLWNYAEDGSSGEITPLRSYRSTNGYYCREYLEVVETAADGRRSRQRIACRDDGGLWKPIRS